MPVSSQQINVSYTGDGSTTSFPVPFFVLLASDLVVAVNGVTKTLNTDYTVSNVHVVGGSTVVFGVAPANGTTVSILRKPPFTQLLSVVDNETLLAQVLDDALDKLTMLAQYFASRSITLADADPTAGPLQLPVSRANGLLSFDTLGAISIFSLPTPAARAGQLLAFDGSGNATTVTPQTGGTTGTANLIDGAVTTVKLLDGAVTEAKLATALAAKVNGKLDLAGGTMTGALVLSADPTSALQAATKQYADGKATSIESVSASVASNALTVGWTPSGKVTFRNPTLSNGAAVQAAVGGALSLTVPSGASLGTISGQQAQLAILLLYNGGTPALAVANLQGGLNLDETGLISSTAISAAATSSSTVYAASAISNSPYRVVGYVNITEATAGTWATAPSLVQGVGGQAMTALASIGFGQTWQDVTASRAINTTYYNTTGRPIQVITQATTSSTIGTPALQVAPPNGSTVNIPGEDHSTASAGFKRITSAIIPPGHSYQLGVPSGWSLASWKELR